MTILTLAIYTLYTGLMYSANRLAAEAAKTSADAAKNALELAKKSAHLEQRAWLQPKKFVIAAEPNQNDQAIVAIYLTNTGKTPALDEWSRGVVNIGADPLPESDYLSTEEIESLGIKTNTRRVFPVGDNDMFAAIVSRKLSDRDLTRYRTPSRLLMGMPVGRLWVHATIHYKDVFGCRHFLEVAAYHGWSDSTWTFGQNNTIDDIQKEDCDK